MLVTSIAVTADDVGPKVRWVKVLRACNTLLSMRLVVNLRYPARSVTDHLSLTGLWFHCQTNGKAASPFLRVNSSLFTKPGIKPLLAGNFKSAGNLPLSPMIGQPFSHLTGSIYGARPTDP